MTFRLTDRQQQAIDILAGPATHVMLYGGSRSGKTFLLVYALLLRALKAPKSRHAILRFRFNAVKASIIYDTFPKVLEVAFPGLVAPVSKTDWFAKLPNGSEIWFGGLDDKERTEKILGQEYATVYLNEASQITWSARNMALTRLAQKAEQQIKGLDGKPLKPRMLYDCNPPPKNHWTYRAFHDKVDPDTREVWANPLEYAWFQMNPDSNRENLSADYLKTLESMSGRMRRRFLYGEFADATPNALFRQETMDQWRTEGNRLPDLVRIVIGVDPSGSGDVDNAENDAIGIVVAGLGTDGNAYILEDCTIKAGPATWGRMAVTAYQRHEADAIVAEMNFGGAMVEQTIEVARKAAGLRVLPFKAVTASRGKIVRAEPFSALYEEGKIRHVGMLPELEDELCAFSTTGYTGDGSPNRADAAIWALSELFPGVMRRKDPAQDSKPDRYSRRSSSSSPWAN